MAEPTISLNRVPVKKHILLRLLDGGYTVDLLTKGYEHPTPQDFVRAKGRNDDERLQWIFEQMLKELDPVVRPGMNGVQTTWVLSPKHYRLLSAAREESSAALDKAIIAALGVTRNSVRFLPDAEHPRDVPEGEQRRHASSKRARGVRTISYDMQPDEEYYEWVLSELDHAKGPKSVSGATPFLRGLLQREWERLGRPSSAVF